MSQQLEQFKSRVSELVKQVREWAEPHEWVTKEYPKKIRDNGQQIDEISSLFLQKGPAKLLLDPIAYDVPGAEGVVDLYLMPTYDDVASLYLKDGQWSISYAKPLDEAGAVVQSQMMPLSELAINQVLDSIAAHAAPSF